MLGFLDFIWIGALVWIASQNGWLSHAAYVAAAVGFAYALHSKIEHPLRGAFLSVLLAVFMVAYALGFDVSRATPFIGLALFTVIASAQRILLRHRISNEEIRR